MSDAPAVTTAAYALGPGLWCLAGVVRRRPLGGGRTAAVGVLQVAAIGQALAAGLAMLLGHRPADLATHIGHLLVSVAILPVAPAAGGGRTSRADPAVAGIAGSRARWS